jgi:8-oxo-dGTP pyrophosphatase MutT (NUDIX family)
MSADDVPAVPAASLILVRDDPELQVLMGERPMSAKAFPGALVFPGGKVEPQDANPAWRGRTGRVEGLDGLALRIAAIREAFEETGLLLASNRSGERPSPGALAAARAAVTAGELDFGDCLDGLGLRPNVAALTPFARWITPLGQRYRFDTWFFIAVTDATAPEPHAMDEFANLSWLGVGRIAEAARLGQIGLLFPTRANLGLLAESRTAAAAVEAARARAIVPVRPEAAVRDGRTVMTIRADAGYSVVDAPSESRQAEASKGDD